MKFAKEIEDDLVPEWRIKYFNYKAGKKYVKGVARAFNRAYGNTPLTLARRGELPTYQTPNSVFLPSPFTPRSGRLNGSGNNDAQAREEVSPLRSSPAPMGRGKTAHAGTPVRPIAASTADGERDGLRTSGEGIRYGSFVPTPPTHSPRVPPAAPSPPPLSSRAYDFALPAPAMRVPSSSVDASSPAAGNKPQQRMVARRSASMLPALPSRSATVTTDGLGGGSSRLGSHATFRPGALRRLFSVASPNVSNPRSEVSLQNWDLVKEKEREFYEFMDGELAKIESFYKEKEEQAGKRLNILREQLHEMRNRRLDQMHDSERNKEREESPHGSTHHNGAGGSGSGGGAKRVRWIEPIKSTLFRPGPNSKALQNMEHSPAISGVDGGAATGPGRQDSHRDYTRRPEDDDVPYRVAKRKLKLALQEFYRSLELLKSYALLNRTAFRKINKKYDKTVNAQPPYRYMNEKVNKAWFVTSDVLDGYIHSVEDLYARYFEKGNHKVAAGKLRSLGLRPRDESATTFRSGFFLGLGAVFAVQGTVAGAELLWDPDPVVSMRASYLLQIYGGYALMLYLFALFCLDCCMWTHQKVNYPFIFEFDPRHHLDWRELAEFPSFFLLLLGFFMWLNFSRFGSDVLFLYYPVILIGLSVILILLPAPILGHRSRKWFAYAHWRLLGAGLYPVEFRDFFLGDMYCSLTYATCNVSLFFCLYAQHWNDPPLCNSSHSRLLGFFAALPPVWRLLQCFRRYYDTRNVFPHLVNGCKYTMSIMAAVTLSLYRISGTRTNFALFILFSLINAIYCSFWDLLMDFSLLQLGNKHTLLRDIMAFKKRWPYYCIMIVDPILRFLWIFYAIFTHNAQHSTIVSFLVALGEVTRRGAWALFRVENEHCGNVAVYKASRDIPLPYSLVSPAGHDAGMHSLTNPTADEDRDNSNVDLPEAAGQADGDTAASTTGAQAGTPKPPPRTGTGQQGVEEGMRRRRLSTASGTTRSIGRRLAEAHRQDFEKKRVPTGSGGGDRSLRSGVDGAGQSVDDDDDDSDSDDGYYDSKSMEDVREAEELVESAESS